MEEEDESLEKLLEWAAEMGITDSTIQNPSHTRNCLGHSLTVSHFPDAGGRGLAAARDLTKGELILRVPKTALFTTECLLKSDQKLSLAVKRHLFLSPSQILIACLLYEVGKGKSSWWYTYLMLLPRCYEILATFGPFEEQALQVDDAFCAAEKAVSKAESEWKQANKLMEELNLKPQLLSFKAWLWASATVSSRTMHISWDEAGCLCPVGDLFNYAAPGEGEESIGIEDVEGWMPAPCLPKGDTSDVLDSEKFNAHLHRLTDGGFEEDINSYCFYARNSYKRGEQVLLGYGTYTNLELLEHYGFLLNENPNDKVFISLEPGMYSCCSWPHESQYIDQNGKPSFALLSALRLWMTPANQRRSVGHLAYSGHQLSVDNEISVMKWISNTCCVMLNNLPTSKEEDVLLLRAIDKIQDINTAMELKKVLSVFGGEVPTILENYCNVQSRQTGAKLSLSRKTKLSIQRWKLAIQWRLGYKKTLADCISYCDYTVNCLLNDNAPPGRIK